MTKAQLCRHPGCGERAARGAYCWRASNSAPAQWLYALVCEEHGALAVRKGARRMSWRPKPLQPLASKVVPACRPMGHVELELRTHREVQSSAAHQVWAGARASLRRSGVQRPDSVDIASEAIEAAEALGL